MSPLELRTARLARGMSQGDLAVIAGVSRGTVKAIEGGKASPREETVAAIAEALEHYGQPRPAAPLPLADLARAADLARIASALERIAASLERSERSS
jgi:transcriptional regulator with XRE-family HTH domain